MRPGLSAPAIVALVVAAAVAAGCGGMPPATDSPRSSAPRSSAPPSSPSSSVAPPYPSSPVALPSPSVPPSTPPPPPYIDRIEWVQETQGPVLQVFPTDAGRTAQGETLIDIAWQEVNVLAPDAPTPGMREQFNCHWVYARAVEPNKASWNLEPWRPVVTTRRMIETGCNPSAP